MTKCFWIPGMEFKSSSHYKNAFSYNWASSRENLSSGLCEKHSRRPACASAQSDQRLCYSLFGKYRM